MRWGASPRLGVLNAYFFLGGIPAALPPAPFGRCSGWLQVEEVGPGESARARQDRATGSRDWGAGARAEGAGPAGAGLAGAGLAGERRTAGEGMGGRHLVERWAQKGSLSWRIPAHRILPLPPVFFSS